MATIQAQGASAPPEPPSAEAVALPPDQHIPVVQKLTLVSWGDGPAPPFPVPDDGESTVRPGATLAEFAGLACTTFKLKLFRGRRPSRRFCARTR